MAPLKIAIIGAGPAGCTLARILTQSTISSSSSLSITLFEGEASLNVRSQGGTLDLHQGSGLDAIRAANLVAEFNKYARYDGEALRIGDKNMTTYLKLPGNSDGDEKTARAPEIDRYRLRQMLLDSLPEDIIRWGKRLSSITEESGGVVVVNESDSDSNSSSNSSNDEKGKSSNVAAPSYTLHFLDGSSATGFDLVVGADGAWSKVRPLVSSAKPAYSGIGGYSLTVSNASTVAPEAVKLVDGGSAFSWHDHIFHSQQRMGDDVMQASVYWVVDDNDPRWADKTGVDVTDVAAVSRYLLDNKLHDWHPRLREIVEKADSANTQVHMQNLFMLPVGHRWEHRRGVTLMGDAAHLMTPFAGEGVNQALADANGLAQEIIEAVVAGTSKENQEVRTTTGATTTTTEPLTDKLDAAVARFEQAMFARTKGMMVMTNKMQNIIFHAPGGLRKNVEKWLLACLDNNEIPARAVSVPLIKVLVYTYYFFFRLFKRPATSL